MGTREWLEGICFRCKHRQPWTLPSDKIRRIPADSGYEQRCDYCDFYAVVQLGQAVKEGWLRPIDNRIPLSALGEPVA